MNRQRQPKNLQSITFQSLLIYFRYIGVILFNVLGMMCNIASIFFLFSFFTGWSRGIIFRLIIELLLLHSPLRTSLRSLFVFVYRVIKDWSICSVLTSHSSVFSLKLYPLNWHQLLVHWCMTEVFSNEPAVHSFLFGRK